MKITTSENADPNYLAVVVKLPEIKPHPTADRLQIIEVFGNTIIIAKDSYIEGESVVYFPVESCINAEFLSWANLFDNAILNSDGKTKGFFSSKGCRVKAVSLRSVPSQGFVFKISKLAEYYNTSPDDFKLGSSFDTVGDNRLVTKYVRPDVKNSQMVFKKSKIPALINDTLGYLPKPIRRAVYPAVRWIYIKDSDKGIKSKIVEGQWNFHGKTEQLGKNLFVLNPDDLITISEKLHGTSFVAGNIICKKDFTLLQKILKLVGKEYKETEYKMVYSSRSVLKNKRDGTYTDDVYGIHAKELEGKIEPTITIYSEICGHVSSGKEIQKNYDYASPKGKSEMFVYRITRTNEEGLVYEFDWSQIENYCKNYELKTVPVHYGGVAKDIFTEIPVDDNWGVNVLNKLRDKYLDKKCVICKNNVVNEGIVLKINNKENCPAFKFKSPKFLIKESSDRDNNESDIEEEN